MSLVLVAPISSPFPPILMFQMFFFTLGCTDPGTQHRDGGNPS
ncbi:unnamed protein product [Staurois parvus]|uniref:Uncharacterized protein n=1 Tax=Staurois parvus TaxID=386267 RepID=A0ABN9DIV6_9NEOB|nr:unnamed protein product [Staurois parvus]